MRKSATLLLGALLAGCAGPSPSLSVRPPADAAPLVLGVFDSRVLAIAYYRSPEFTRLQQARMGAYSAAGPEEQARIEAEMQALQDRMHRQGFSTAPIPEILALIEDELPEIARSAGAQAVASKWDLVWSERNAPVVDLSLALAEAFSPSEETRRMLPEILARDPVPLAELEARPH